MCKAFNVAQAAFIFVKLLKMSGFQVKAELFTIPTLIISCCELKLKIIFMTIWPCFFAPILLYSYKIKIGVEKLKKIPFTFIFSPRVVQTSDSCKHAHKILVGTSQSRGGPKALCPKECGAYFSKC